MLSLDTLRKVHIFAGLEEAELEPLNSYLQQIQVEKGDYVLQENSVGDCIFILVKGTVRVCKELVKGIGEDMADTQKVLATLDGSMLPTFGENGILGQAPRTANVIAATDCVLYTLAKRDFDSYARQHIQAAYQVMKNIAEVLSQRLNTTDENLVKLATALYIAVQN
ncbi:MAG: family transcriptional regulator, cyclic receptor protein [Candidatus Cloacimonadota bacterium]|jgi:CRP-like cAMP-binding protein|nr:family transcriptional regulator, cyclic receptor protein [Candidatus Cloacimonadota bacterium]